ncbi:TPA: hypothetical protein RZC39_003625 [Salmonella enterica subsp. enterica serovar Liverpool]|uniref:Uncharacterized protein n=6 Tax=Salmonella enterica TaxID=28901 RepID=A0A602CJZ1_SALER|nr:MULTISPECIES: hypothetical protein [Salmonella]AZT00079.1 hypothetical protein ELZ80_14460 [Salmonella enterica subsp. enterica serovar Mikawasima]AZT08363.1 hypothetical protein ELZ87_14255 [Salmonella enterica subsp. enterica serovar 43:a:1,7]AZT16736.1 hypothetical protein ELZ77_14195 [Salmonella enterica subsp. enterica serovar Stanleyville]AZT77174.1 hypothetical protein ELZ70_14155 [Salmonella enterica subsp. enterica serovar Bareilly]EAA6407136.1 hypothetical protein [Salmonella ente
MTLQANISKEIKAAKTQEVYKHVVLFKMAASSHIRR